MNHFATTPFLVTLLGALWWMGGIFFSVRSALRKGRTAGLLGLDRWPRSALVLVSAAGPLAAILGGLLVGSWIGQLRPLAMLAPVSLVLIAFWVASGMALAILLEGRGGTTPR